LAESIRFMVCKCLVSSNARRVFVFVSLRVFMLSSAESILVIMDDVLFANVLNNPSELLSIAFQIDELVFDIEVSVVVIEF